MVKYLGFVDDWVHAHRGLIFELWADISSVKRLARRAKKDTSPMIEYSVLENLPDWRKEVVSNLRSAVVFPCGSRPSMKHVLRILLDVARALCGIHQRGILHRDIADRNILCNGRLRIRVADFGLSKVVGVPDCDEMVADYYKESHTDDFRYPVMTMAPETLDEPAVFSTAADVWSLGMLMYQCVANRDPYGLVGRKAPGSVAACLVTGAKDIAHRILDGETPDISKVRRDCPNDLASLIESC